MKSNTAKNMVLNFLTRNQSVSQPAQLYLALYTTDPTGADTGTEASYVGYARQPVTFTAPQLQSNDRSTVSNASALEFGVVPSASGTIAYAGLKTAMTGGSLVYYGPLAATYQLNQGVQPVVPVGNLSVSET